MAKTYDTEYVMTMEFEDGGKAEIYRQIIPEDERKRREKRLEKAAADVIKARIDAGRFQAV